LGKGPRADHLEFLIAAVETKPDIAMPELAAFLWAERGVSAHGPRYRDFCAGLASHII
jgi:hypothetical protein